MKTKIIEATNGARNWGRFMVMRPDVEWHREAAVETPSRPNWPVLSSAGWSREHIIVYDLVTNEGATFAPGGQPHHDLEKHRIWVCPMYEPFLTWLYEQDLSDLDALPDIIDLPDAEFAMQGYRRAGS